jgi:hypothetical protein
MPSDSSSLPGGECRASPEFPGLVIRSDHRASRTRSDIDLQTRLLGLLRVWDWFGIAVAGFLIDTCPYRKSEPDGQRRFNRLKTSTEMRLGCRPRTNLRRPKPNWTPSLSRYCLRR